MKLTPTIYHDEYKSNANYAFSSMYNTLAEAVQARNEDMQDDEVNQLVNDIIISNVLGTVTTFDHVHALLKRDTDVNIIAELETIADNIEGDTHNADCILDLIAKLKQR